MRVIWIVGLFYHIFSCGGYLQQQHTFDYIWLLRLVKVNPKLCWIQHWTATGCSHDHERYHGSSAVFRCPGFGGNGIGCFIWLEATPPTLRTGPLFCSNVLRGSKHPQSFFQKDVYIIFYNIIFWYILHIFMVENHWYHISNYRSLNMCNLEFLI